MLLLAMVYQVCVSNMINLPHVVVDWKKVCFNWWRWNTTDFSGQKKRSAVVVRRIMKIYGNDAPKLLGIPSKDHSQPYTYIDIPQIGRAHV